MGRNNLKAYKNPKLGLYERFIKPDEESELWRQRFLRAYYECGAKRDLGLFSLVGFKHISLKHYATIQIFDLFSTANVSDREFKYEVQFLKSAIAPCTRILTSGRDSLTIFSYEDNDIPIRTITSVFPQFDERIPILKSHVRSGKCHELSLDIALAFKGDAKVITGAMYTIHPNEMFLHSVVEKVIDGEAYILDATRNMVMRKSDYYTTFHVQPLCEISNKRLREDWKDLSILRAINSEYLKLYLSNRVEAMTLLSDIIAEKCRRETGHEAKKKFLNRYIEKMVMLRERAELSHEMIEPYISDEETAESFL